MTKLDERMEAQGWKKYSLLLKGQGLVESSLIDEINIPYKILSDSEIPDNFRGSLYIPKVYYDILKCRSN